MEKATNRINWKLPRPAAEWLAWVEAWTLSGILV